MSKLLERARQEAWNDRAEYGRVKARKRKWVIDTWHEGGRIAPEHADAARRLWRVIEMGFDPSLPTNLDRVDGGVGDAHTTALASAFARRSLHATHQWMRARLMRKGIRWAIYTRVFDHDAPQVTAQELQALVRAGNDAARVARHLDAVLSLLLIYQKKNDADADFWLESAGRISQKSLISGVAASEA